MKKTKAVFVDFDNLFLCTKHRLGHKLANKVVNQLPKLLNKLNTDQALIINNVYVNDKAFAQFLPHLTQAGFRIKTCRPVTNQGKTVADTEMTADIITALLTVPNLDEIVILSDDADFIPVLNRAKEQGVKTTVLTVNHCAKAYTSLADNKQSVLTLLDLKINPCEKNEQLTQDEKLLLESKIISYLIVGLPLHISDLLSAVQLNKLWQFNSYSSLIKSLNLAPYSLNSGLIFNSRVFCLTDKWKEDSQYRVNLKNMTHKQFIEAFFQRYPKSITEVKEWLLIKLKQKEYFELSQLLKTKKCPRLFKRIQFLDDQLQWDFFTQLLPKPYRLSHGYVFDHSRFTVQNEQANICLFNRADKQLIKILSTNKAMPHKLACSLGLPNYSKQTFLYFFESLANGLKRFIGDLNALANYIKQKLNSKAITISLEQVKKIVFQLQNYGHYFSQQDTPRIFIKLIADHLKRQYRSKNVTFTHEEKQQIKTWLAA